MGAVGEELLDSMTEQTLPPQAGAGSARVTAGDGRGQAERELSVGRASIPREMAATPGTHSHRKGCSSDFLDSLPFGWRGLLEV